MPQGAKNNIKIHNIYICMYSLAREAGEIQQDKIVS